MTLLTSSHRKQLKSKAHHLKPVVFIGKQGLTDTVRNAVDVSLTAHELIKVKFNDCKDQKKEITAQIAEDTQCEIAGILGHIAILYRQHPDPEKRKVRLR